MQHVGVTRVTQQGLKITNIPRAALQHTSLFEPPRRVRIRQRWVANDGQGDHGRGLVGPSRTRGGRRQHGQGGGQGEGGPFYLERARGGRIRQRVGGEAKGGRYLGRDHCGGQGVQSQAHSWKR